MVVLFKNWLYLPQQNQSNENAESKILVVASLKTRKVVRESVYPVC